MTPSPDLIDELRASRPVAPAALRARVRETVAEPARPSVPIWDWLRLPLHRVGRVAVPAALVLAVASAGVVGLSRSDTSGEALREQTTTEQALEALAPTSPGAAQDSTIGPGTGRAQRVSATLTVEVRDSDAVSDVAREALQLTQRLGGHVVSSSVSTGEERNAAITVRVPVGKVQDAITGLSALGRIVSQQVTVDDLQEGLDALERREASVRGQIARIQARLATEPLDAQTEAVLRTRLQTLRAELRQLRAQIAATSAEARMATIQLTVVTEDAQGGVAGPSRLDRTLDEALNVLVWEGVVTLAIAIVVAPFALLALAAWLGRRLYRRHEDERLLTQP